MEQIDLKIAQINDLKIAQINDLKIAHTKAHSIIPDPQREACTDTLYHK